MPFFPANALVALAAAATWGGGDFSGGMAVKAAGNTLRSALRAILIAHAFSLLALAGVVLLRHKGFPSGAPLAWGLGAGVAAGLSLAAFYLALARGAMGASAALSGLLAAGIPVVVSWFLQGTPTWLQGVGFVIAAAAIWLIAAGDEGASTSGGPQRGTMALALFGGIGFGIYFVALERANTLGVFQPMMLARVGSVMTCLVLLLLTHRRSEGEDPRLSSSAKFWIGGIALLDTAGNLLFITATRLGRLDAAAVLASLYPASTILLAAWHLHERPRRTQLVGMLLALGAVVLITV